MHLKKLASLALVSYSVTTLAANSVLLDGKKIKTGDDLSALIKKQLPNNELNGGGVETIYNILLSENKTDSVVRVKNLAILRKKLGEQYVDNLIGSISDAAEENPRIVLVLE